MKLNLLAVALIICVVSATKTNDEIVEQFQVLLKELPSKLQNAEEAGNIIDDIGQFFTGLWDGIKVAISNDAQMFKICYESFPDSLKELDHFWNFLKNWWAHPDFIELIDEVVELFGDLLSNHMPCYVVYSYIQHIDAIYKLITGGDIKSNLIITLAANAQTLYRSSAEFFACVFTRKPYCAGEQLGKLLITMTLH